MSAARGTLLLPKNKALAGLGAVVALALALVGCAPAAAPSIGIDADTVIVDVRTPAEYADGHLEGAVNIDVQSPEFDAEIAELDTEGDYVVYCRSGNRSAQAASRMESAGLTVRDAGGLSDAESATGLPIVR